MTQKELLYLEDAVKHEQNIIAVCNDTISRLEDKSLKTFLKTEVKKHNSMLNKILNMLEDEANE